VKSESPGLASIDRDLNDAIEAELSESTRNSEAVDMRGEDIYDGPQSPAPHHPLVSSNRLLAALKCLPGNQISRRHTPLTVSQDPVMTETSNQTSKKKQTRHSDGAEAGRQAKRFKPKHTSAHGGNAEGTAGKNRLDPTSARKRISPRAKKVRKRPGYLTGERYNEFVGELDANSPRATGPSNSPSPSPANSTIVFTPRHASSEEIGITASKHIPSHPPQGLEPTPSIADGTASPSTPRLKTSSAKVSRPSLDNLSDPPSIPASETPKESRRANEQQNLPPMAEPPKREKRGKPSIIFIYRVIISRRPIYMSKTWNPKGKFQDKSLSELIEELPLEGDVKGLVFTLEGPNMNVEEEIYRGDEGRFEAMKRHFNRLIRARLGSRDDSSSDLILEIEIEPLRDKSESGEDEDDDGTLEW
jgi:hypothetical protein